MNPSEPDREEENLIELLNSIFDIFENNKLIHLKTLANEHALKQILISIEPKLEEIGGKIELSSETSFGIRYANFVSVLNSVYKFIELYPDRYNFTQQADFKLQVKINELLRCEQRQLLLIAELIIFLSSISSKKDHFDKLEISDEKYLMLYLSISEKYVVHRSEESILGRSSHVPCEDMRTSGGYRTFQTQNERLAALNEDLKASIEELTKDLKSKKEIISNYEKYINELDLKYKDALREIESMKNSTISNRKVEEELLMENININKLKSLVSQKELEIADVKKEKDLAIKILKEEITGLNEKIVIYEDKISSFKSLVTENDKLKSKLKEMSLLKDKERELDEMVLTVESKTRMIENLIQEKQILTSQVNKAQKDFYEGKEKFRQLENEKKKVEMELEEIKKDHMKLENSMYKGRDSSAKRTSYPDPSASGKCLFDLDQAGVYVEIEKAKDDRFKLLEKQFEDLKTERNELLVKSTFLAEDFDNLVEEKNQIAEKMEQETSEKKKIIIERDKLLLEKEKLLLKLQKDEIDFQKIQMNLENDKKKAESELLSANEKIKKINHEKNLLYKEYESTKNEHKGVYEKILKEKSEIICDLQKEIERLKVPLDKEKKRGGYSQGSAEDISALKLENQNLRALLSQKDDLIKTLHAKITTLETENTNVSSQLHESYDRFNQDILKRSEDLEFYKRSYEEQKNRVNREHELISSSFYELALQFMSLKSDLQKKMNSGTHVKTTWLDNERMKNFP